MTNRFITTLISIFFLAGCAPFIDNLPPTIQPTPIEEVSTVVSTLPVLTEAPVERPTVEPTSDVVPETPKLLAYIAPNGNVVLKNLMTGEETPITSDGTGESIVEGVGMIRYSQLDWSSDGLLLAFKREFGKIVGQGLDYTYSLQVYNPQTGETKILYESTSLSGFDWQPGTHLIAYAVGVDPNYWVLRGGVNADLARGISTVDADSGATAELVKPERGLHLVLPQWAPNGKVLGFEEVELMEGRGKFAYFDTTDGKYTALEQQVGNYDWLPDGQKIVYDTLVYTGAGTERIWIANRDGSGAQRISPDSSEGYAFMPVLSPSGELVAYFIQFGDPGEPSVSKIKLYVQPLEAVEPRELAEFENVYDLAWSTDGTSLLITSGPYEGRVIMQLRLAEGPMLGVSMGSSPAMQP